MANKIQNNMRKIAWYNKIVSLAYKGDDAARFAVISRELKLNTVDLFDGLNYHIFSEIRKDIMTLGVGCICLFEEQFGDEWGKNSNTLSDDQNDRLEEWELVREQIFDNINTVIQKYQKLLLRENNEQENI